MEFSTLHIFAYGEAQLIKTGFNFKADIKKFKKLKAVIDDVKLKRPTEILEKEFHAIHIMPSGVSYMSKEGNEGSFRIDFKSLDVKKIDALLAEFEVIKVAEEKTEA